MSIKHWAQLLYAIKFIKKEGGRRAVLTRLHTLTLIKTQKHQGVPGFLLLSSGYILMVTLETCEPRLGDFFLRRERAQACLVKRPGVINWGLQGEARAGEHMSSHLLIASPMQVPSPNMLSCWTVPIPPGRPKSRVRTAPRSPTGTQIQQPFGTQSEVFQFLWAAVTMKQRDVTEAAEPKNHLKPVWQI